MECLLRVGASWTPTLTDGLKNSVPFECSLTCQSNRGAEIRHLAVTLQDGSRCGRLDVERAACLEGRCVGVGCDDVIGSTKRVDQCGVCGGDGRSCAHRVFRWRDTLEFSSCDKTCGPDRIRVSVSVCVNTITDRVVPERLCADQQRPRPKIKRCPYVTCPVKWMASEWTECSSSCSAHKMGSQWREVLCVEVYRRDEQPPLEPLLNLMAGSALSSLHPPTTTTKPMGMAEEGNLVENRRVADHFCQHLRRPAEVRECFGSGDCHQSDNGEQQLREGGPNGHERADDGVESGGDATPGRSRERPAPLPAHGERVSYDESGWRRDNSKPTYHNFPVVDPHIICSPAGLVDLRFHASEWSECSVSCGVGVQTRSADCVAQPPPGGYHLQQHRTRLPDYECDGQSKPALFQPCGGGDGDDCSTSRLGPPPALRTSEVLPELRYRPLAEFAPLEHSNHVGNAPNESVEDGEEEARPGPGEKRPRETTTSMQLAHFPGTGGVVYRWDYGEWTPCTASCSGGKQRSTLKCTDYGRNVSVAPANCDNKQRPIDLTRSCNKQPCTPEWETTDWSTCSHSCGGGIRSRRVRCIQKVAKGASREFTSDTDPASARADNSANRGMVTLIVPEAQCYPTARPVEREACAVDDCPPRWRVDEWSPCSVSCGAGEQRRDVDCEQRSALGTTRLFNPPYECMGEERPPTVQLCDLGPCNANGDPARNGGMGETVARDTNRGSAQSESQYEQTYANHRKLTLNVGGFANLYEGTSVKVKCPVQRGFNKKRVYWTRDGRKVVNNAHIKVSSNGALRIFHAKLDDAGVYVCYANGAQGNVTLRFKTREANENGWRTVSGAHNNKMMAGNSHEDARSVGQVRASLLRLREYRMLEELNKLLGDPSASVPSALRVDFSLGDWSRCSQLECGKPDGAQVRLIKCQLRLHQLMAYLDEEVCEAFGLRRPPATRACDNPDCPRWEASDWSQCSKSRCVRHEMALQRREVRCVHLNGTEARAAVLCDRRSRPKIKKECVNVNCTAEWRPSPWGRCSKTCGEGGVQLRLLRCTWKGTRKPAGRNCEADPTLRPPAIRACTREENDSSTMELPPCPNSSEWENKSLLPSPPTAAALQSGSEMCEDQSRFCDILKLFHSCDQESIRSRCCFSCHSLDSASDTSRLSYRHF